MTIVEGVSVIGGVINQTGGVNSAASLALVTGGSYAISGSAQMQIATDEIIGGVFYGYVDEESTGTLLQDGGTNNSNRLLIGHKPLFKGTCTIAGGTLTTNSAYLGGDPATGAGGQGILNIDPSSGFGQGPPPVVGVFVSGLLKVWNTPGTIVNVRDRGTLSVGSLDLSGNKNLLNWTGGNIAFTNSLLKYPFAAP